MKLLLDTCALLWWTLDQQQLPTSTLTVLNNSEMLVSSISIWELGIKIKNKKLDIGMTIEVYAEKLTELSTMQILPVTDKLWIKNLGLEWEHRDPADRTIVATAMIHDCWIVTTDHIIRDFYPRIFW
ncbi:MAG: type II toxin-antitoxin system VapC family toxin [Gammaproteobacteria bacterium]|nr:type II toxin-antitoxin system VapC family toxin [Gammaproteobacteria bacterium]